MIMGVDFPPLLLYLYKSKFMEQEIWKPILGVKGDLYDGYYEVSNLGRIKMLPRLLRHSKGMRVSKEKIVIGSNSHGYKVVSFKKDGIKKMQNVHVLVARAFVDNPNPEKFRIVNHLNSDRADNRAENLEWCDHSRNAKHAIEAGKLKITKGSERSTAILNEDKALAIKLLYKTGRFSYWKLSIMFDIGKTTVQSIIEGTSWTHVV
jgi:hypothetical protein